MSRKLSGDASEKRPPGNATPGSDPVIAFLRDHAEDVRALYATEQGRIWLALLVEYYLEGQPPTSVRQT